MKKILFPVLQDISSRLAPTVVKLAKALEAEVHLLHIAPPTDSFLESRMRSDREWMTRFAENHLKEVSVHLADVIPGDPAKEIMKYSEEHGMNLIVMATHGRKGIDRFYFGHVAENVVAQASIPVLSINVGKCKTSFLD